MGPVQTSIADRLGSTLCLAALAHGVLILGVTFTASPLEETGALPVLNVALIVDTADVDANPEDAQFLSERDQRGAGALPEGVRPTTTLAGEGPFSQPGDQLGADLESATPRQPVPSAEQLVTRQPAAQRLRALPDVTATPADVPMRAAVLVDRQSPRTLAAEIDLHAALPSEHPNRELIASPSTRESTLASYLDAWRRRVERIGTVNFPEQLRNRATLARPTLEVAIGADGGIEEIVVHRSSGNRALDQAALDILRMASPFEPLPDVIRAEYDVLRFAYEWDFFGDGSGQTAPLTGSPPN